MILRKGSLCRHIDVYFEGIHLCHRLEGILDFLGRTAPHDGLSHEVSSKLMYKVRPISTLVAGFGSFDEVRTDFGSFEEVN